MKNSLFLEIKNTPTAKQGFLECPIETLVALYVYKYCNLSDIHLNFVPGELKSHEPYVKICVDEFKHTFIYPDNLPWKVSSCKLPVATSEFSVITGLCAVSRFLAKQRKEKSCDSEHPEGLLGFRSGCLQAPNEVSVWTKFCEVELLTTTTELHYNTVFDKFDNENNFVIPDNIARFEQHLDKPLRVHNVYKLARDMAKISLENETNPVPSTNNTGKNMDRLNAKQRKWKSNKKSSIIESSTPIENLKLEHKFAEGPFLTLADVILFPCYSLIFSCLNIKSLEKLIPKTLKWFRNLQSFTSINKCNSILFSVPFQRVIEHNDIYQMPQVDNVSLYKTDPKRSNPRKRIFTKEDDVESALQLIVDGLELNLNFNRLTDPSLKIDWSSIPPEANPYGGHLPDKRMERKTQQLENLAVAVMQIAQEGDRIVDFCSGSGHLGILLGYLLPKCTIVLLENKEQSLALAMSRVHNLKLNNVTFFQCNLDFFKGSFDIGVALHACGIATDLVLENCIKSNASFVVCPCCYGSLHTTKRLLYPRSPAFANIPIKEYMCIGHAADQTHVDHPMEERGARCMTIIDSDRAHYATTNGYTVTLSRLVPLSCTPKNMLLIGVSGK